MVQPDRGRGPSVTKFFERKFDPEHFAQTPVKTIDLSVFQTAAVRSALADLPNSHILQGAFLPGTPPILLGRLPDGTGPSDFPMFMPWCWAGTFGACVTISTLVGEGTWVRCWINPRSDGFSTLDAGVVRFAVVQHRLVRCVYEVEFSANPNLADWYREMLNHARSHVAVIEDARAHFYEALSHWHGAVSAADQLRVGWVLEYEARLQRVRHEQTQLPHFSIDSLDPAPSEDLRRCLELVQGGESALADLIAIATSQIREHGIWPLTRLEHAYLDDHLPAELDGFLHMVESTACISTDLTDAGRVLPIPKMRCLPHGVMYEGTVELEIDPEHFDPPISPKDYWQRLPGFHDGFAPTMLTGRDVPVAIEILRAAAEQLKTDTDLAELEALADALLEEAANNKRAVIPPNAIVQLSVGPFRYVQVLEVERCVHFLLRFETGEFFPLALHVDSQNWWGNFPAAPNAQPALVALQLLLAAVVRDFWVVEDREAVFSAEPSLALPRILRSGAGPRIVYVPRVRYTHAPDVTGCTESLGHQERRAHFVRAHVRRCEHATAGQVILANKYGVQIPAGYTFVRPHERGHLARDVIYRSRSALRCLYIEDNTRLQKGPVKWFQFERDVQSALTGLGFEVEHVAASRTGDRGIDLVARKGAGLEEVIWIIQAKCWSKKVGPSVVRDLNGAMLHQERGVRGMVITTSSFTKDAKREAQETGIRLMDGAEFSALANSD